MGLKRHDHIPRIDETVARIASFTRGYTDKSFSPNAVAQIEEMLLQLVAYATPEDLRRAKSKYLSIKQYEAKELKRWHKKFGHILG